MNYMHYEVVSHQHKSIVQFSCFPFQPGSKVNKLIAGVLHRKTQQKQDGPCSVYMSVVLGWNTKVSLRYAEFFGNIELWGPSGLMGACDIILAALPLYAESQISENL